MVEDRGHATRPDEQGHAVSHDQSLWMVHLQTLAIHQRDGKWPERRPMLESADRAVKSVSVHCVSPGVGTSSFWIVPRTHRTGNTAPRSLRAGGVCHAFAARTVAGQCETVGAAKA